VRGREATAIWQRRGLCASVVAIVPLFLRLGHRLFLLYYNWLRVVLTTTVVFPLKLFWPAICLRWCTLTPVTKLRNIYKVCRSRGGFAASRNGETPYSKSAMGLAAWSSKLLLVVVLRLIMLPGSLIDNVSRDAAEAFDVIARCKGKHEAMERVHLLILSIRRLFYGRPVC
jgi:hypothetical protein